MSEQHSSDQSSARAESDSNALTTERQKVTPPDGSQKIIEPEVRAVVDQIHHFQKSSSLQAEGNTVEPPWAFEAAQTQREGSLTQRSQGVVAKNGDNLSSIIKRTYGKYDEEILGSVLRENPEIQNPDLISAGQVIELPVLADKP